MNYIIAFIMFLAGIGVIFRCILEPKKCLKKCTVKSKGVIISSIETKFAGSNSNATGIYIPEYQYSYNNQTYTQQVKNEYRTEPQTIGEEIDIWINPNNPKEIVTAREKSSSNYSVWIVTSIICFASALFLIAAA